MSTKVTHGTKLLKAQSEGEGVVTVAFAQLNVIDHDADVTIPGAFEPGQKVKVCQTGHAHGIRVAGAGTIVGEQEIDGALWAVAELKFFLNTEAGREEYATIKALDELGHTQEFSYGYDILEAAPGQMDGRSVQILKRLSAYEISPVLRGAGIGTHQLSVKGRKDWSTHAVGQAWHAQHPHVEGETNGWVEDVRLDPNTVIVRKGDTLLQIPYAIGEDDAVTFDEDAAIEVQLEYVPKSRTETGDEHDGGEPDAPQTDAKGRATDLFLQFEAMKLRRATATRTR